MVDHKAILERMQAAYEADKQALSPLDWKPDHQRERILRMPIVCDCSPADVIGVSIIGTAWKDDPEERVSFQLCIDVRGTDFRIARVDWRPRQPHTNRHGPPGLRGLTVDTSIHDYPENAALGLSKMQAGNLPIVKPIEPEPDDFKGLLHYLRDTFRLKNALDIPVPPWSKPLI